MKKTNALIASALFFLQLATANGQMIEEAYEAGTAVGFTGFWLEKCENQAMPALKLYYDFASERHAQSRGYYQGQWGHDFDRGYEDARVQQRNWISLVMRDVERRDAEELKAMSPEEREQTTVVEMCEVAEENTRVTVQMLMGIGLLPYSEDFF